MAFVELNKLLGSIFILEYIDNQKLREDVQKSLNYGEYYHKLKKKVVSLLGGRIKNSEEYDQVVYQYSSMLLCSIIVYYNSLIQSRFLIDFKDDEKMLDIVKKTTPYAWDHINFLGKYEFKNSFDEKKIDNFMKLRDNDDYLSTLP
jgi:TnpA family transposase